MKNNYNDIQCYLQSFCYNQPLRYTYLLDEKTTKKFMLVFYIIGILASLILATLVYMNIIYFTDIIKIFVIVVSILSVWFFIGRLLFVFKNYDISGEKAYLQHNKSRALRDFNSEYIVSCESEWGILSVFSRKKKTRKVETKNISEIRKIDNIYFIYLKQKNNVAIIDGVHLLNPKDSFANSLNDLKNKGVRYSEYHIKSMVSDADINKEIDRGYTAKTILLYMTNRTLFYTQIVPLLLIAILALKSLIA